VYCPIHIVNKLITNPVSQSFKAASSEPDDPILRRVAFGPNVSMQASMES